jgi:hypothetical protein
MQEPTATVPPHGLSAVVRVGLAAAVVLVLSGLLTVATSASHTAVHTMSAQLHDTTRHVKLPAVEIVGRREAAMGAPDGDAAGRSAAASTATPPGCPSDRPEAG